MTVGDKLTTVVTVTEAQTAKAMGSGDLPVLATPALIAIMENTAMQCSIPALHKGETTVGTEINIKHLRAAKVGAVVETTAELIDAKGHKGRQMIFHVSSTVDGEEIGEGFHVRYVVDAERFMAKFNE